MKFTNILIVGLLLCVATISQGQQPTQTDIVSASNTAEAQGRIVKIGAGGISVPDALKELTTLPVVFRSVISGWNYDIVVFKMNITASVATVSVGCRFQIPDSPQNTSLFFGASNIQVSAKSGFSGDLDILENTLEASSDLNDPQNKLGGQNQFAEFALPTFNQGLYMGLGKGTKLNFSCGEFKKFTLAGFLKSYDKVEKEDSNGNSLADSNKPLMFFWGTKDVFDWQDIFFEASVSNNFHALNLKDVGFRFTDQTKIIIDLSKYQNSPNLPACVGSNAWQGISFDSFGVRLPTLFNLKKPRPLTSNGTNLFLGVNGLLGNVVAENVFSIEEGYTDPINKFDMSLDWVNAQFDCNTPPVLNMKGRIRLGNCTLAAMKAKEVNYNMVYDASKQSYSVACKESNKANFQNGGLTLSTGSSLTMAVQDGGLQIKTIVASKPILTTTAQNNAICANSLTQLNVNATSGYRIKWSNGEIDQNSITVAPSQTTTYQVTLLDEYCIEEKAEITIKVFDKLQAPTFTNSQTTICSYQATSLAVNNLVGKLEWSTPEEPTFHEVGSNQDQLSVTFPKTNSTLAYTYKARFVLNGCVSPEAVINLTIHPEPPAPTLYSNANNNTIDRNTPVLLSGNCQNNSELVWEGLPQNPAKPLSAKTFYAVCRNNQTGCQTQGRSGIYINVLYDPPVAPTQLRFSNITTSSHTLSWSDIANNEDGYKILRSTDASFANPVAVGSVGKDVTKFDDSNLQNGMTYYYKVVAFNRFGEAFSEIGPTTTLIPVPICTVTQPNINASKTPIEVGQTVSITATCSQGTLVWTLPANFTGGNANPTSLTTYKAKCKVSADCESPEGSATVVVNNVPTCTIPAAPKVGNNVTICKGNTAILAATNCTGGTIKWSSGSSMVSPTTTSEYTATCTIGNCTSGPSTPLKVTVSDPMKPEIKASQTTINTGQTVSVTATCSQGTVVWTLPANFSGGNASPTTLTTYKARCKLTDGCESSENDVTVLVNSPTCIVPNPPNVGSSLTICKGSSATLSATGCGGGVIKWSSGSSSVNPNITTEYTATCTLNGCTSGNSTPLKVIVLDPVQPEITSDRYTIETGQSVNLTATCKEGSVTWTLPNGFSGGTHNPNTTTTYKARCVQQSCESYEGTTVVTVNPVACSTPQPPTIGSEVTICRGQTANLTASGCNGSLNWSSNSAKVTPSTSTIYFATCTVGGCTSANSSSLKVVVIDVTIPTTVRATKNPLCGSETTSIAADPPSGATLSWDNGQAGTPTVGQGTYRVRSEYKGCYSAWSEPIVVVAKPIPATPTTVRATASALCPGQQTYIAADVVNGATLVWDNGQSGAPKVGVGQYKAKAVLDGCSSDWSTAITVSSKNNPATPKTPRATTPSLCPGQQTYLAADVENGATLVWDNGQTGTPKVGAGQYKAKAVFEGGCESDWTSAVVVSSRNNPATPQNPRATTPTLCPNQQTYIAADVENGATLVWDNGQSGTPKVGVGQYKAKAIVDGCSSDWTTAVTVSGRNNPAVPKNPRATTPNLCPNEQTYIAADVENGATLVWDNGQTGTPKVGSGQYKAKAVFDGGCESDWTSTITVNAKNAPYIPTTPRATYPEVCPNQLTYIAADVQQGATLLWDNGQSGTPQVSIGTYKACAVLEGCRSDWSAIVTVKAINLVAPSISNTGSKNLCGSQTTKLTSDKEVYWYQENTFKGTGLSIDVGVGNNYRAKLKQGGCESDWSNSIDITAGAIDNPVLTSNRTNICEGSTTDVHLSTNSTGMQIFWSVNNGEPVKDNSNRSVGKGTYKVFVENGSCKSGWSNVVEIKEFSRPTAPTNARFENGKLIADGIGSFIWVKLNPQTNAFSYYSGGNNISADEGTYKVRAALSVPECDSDYSNEVIASSSANIPPFYTIFVGQVWNSPNYYTQKPALEVGMVFYLDQSCINRSWITENDFVAVFDGRQYGMKLKDGVLLSFFLIGT